MGLLVRSSESKAGHYRDMLVLTLHLKLVRFFFNEVQQGNRFCILCQINETFLLVTFILQKQADIVMDHISFNTIF